MITLNRVSAFYSKHDLFSNHYLAEMSVKGVTFNCVEQFFMFTKAMYFKDTEVAQKIMETISPFYQKKLGKQVHPFDDEKWHRVKRHYMYIGVKAKVLQNPEIRDALLATGNTLLVEASETDTYWGVGIGIDDTRLADPTNWKGRNELGKILMRIRGELHHGTQTHDVLEIASEITSTEETRHPRRTEEEARDVHGFA